MRVCPMRHQEASSREIVGANFQTFIRGQADEAPGIGQRRCGRLSGDGCSADFGLGVRRD